MAKTQVDSAQLKDGLVDSHYIKLCLSAGQNVATGTEDTPADIVWETALTKSPNTTAFHNVASNAARIYPQQAGIWLFTTQIYFTADSTGIRVARINLNGISRALVSTLGHGTNNQRIQASAMIIVSNVGTDYITVGAGHNSGTTLALGSGENDTWVYGLLVRRL